MYRDVQRSYYLTVTFNFDDTPCTMSDSVNYTILKHNDIRKLNNLIFNIKVRKQLKHVSLNVVSSEIINLEIEFYLEHL